jgi:hypothetical protein
MKPRFPGPRADAVHLERRMEERGVSWGEVLTVVANPDKVVRSHSGRSNYYAVVGRRRLRVTMNDESGEIFTVAIAEQS